MVFVCGMMGYLANTWEVGSNERKERRSKV